jgi:hypothetical protein
MTTPGYEHHQGQSCIQQNPKSLASNSWKRHARSDPLLEMIVDLMGHDLQALDWNFEAE